MIELCFSADLNVVICYMVSRSMVVYLRKVYSVRAADLSASWISLTHLSVPYYGIRIKKTYCFIVVFSRESWNISFLMSEQRKLALTFNGESVPWYSTFVIRIWPRSETWLKGDEYTWRAFICKQLLSSIIISRDCDRSCSAPISLPKMLSINTLFIVLAVISGRCTSFTSVTTIVRSSSFCPRIMSIATRRSALMAVDSIVSPFDAASTTTLDDMVRVLFFSQQRSQNVPKNLLTNDWNVLENLWSRCLLSTKDKGYLASPRLSERLEFIFDYHYLNIRTTSKNHPHIWETLSKHQICPHGNCSSLYNAVLILCILLCVALTYTH